MSAARWTAMALTFAVAQAGPFPESAAADSEPMAGARFDDTGQMTPAELAPRLAKLTSPSVEARRAAAREVAELDETATAAIVDALAALRKTEPDLAGVLLATRPQRGARGATDAFDALDAVVRTEPNGDAYRTVVATLALTRALGHIATADAAHELMRVAGDHDGAFRAEVTQQVKRIGERAVPALIALRRDPSPGVRRWAIAQLEAMGRTRPGEAIQTKSNAILADVLRAYAEVHDLDALTVTLSFVNADRAQVRSAARDGVAAYGDDALPRLREAYATLTGKSAPEEWTAAVAAKELFAAYDRLRLQDVDALVEEGLARAQAGKIDDAVLSFDKALARQPLLDRRAEMAPTYVQYAHSIEARDKAGSLAYLHKAARLDPGGPHAAQIESEVLTLEAEDLVARGIADADAFRRALAKDPRNARARADLDRLEIDEGARRDRVKRLAAAALVLLLALVAIILFGGRPGRGKRARNDVA